MQALFETNFHGFVRVTNAVLPILRAQGTGRILNVGSVVGLIPGPFGAYYAASKHAIEGYSESLDHEVRPFGIRVAVIEPWATKTSIEANSPQGGSPGGGLCPDHCLLSVGLRHGNGPEPTLGDDEVLVQIHAAGVNLLDAKIRDGEFKPILPYKMPLILGHDMAGTVVKTGPKATRYKVGDEVYSRVPDFHIGTFAEFIAVKEAALAAKPKSLSMEEAASVPLVALTVWQALMDIAKLRAGQKVFIQAGSGGVGTFAIQLAKHIGAYVATTASAANADWLKALGADLVIDYKTQDFETVLRDYDVVLQSQDAKALEKSLNVLRPGGRLVSITGPATPAFATAVEAPWFLKPVFWALSRGTYKRARDRKVGFDFLFMKVNGAQLQEIAALIDAGHIRPVIDRIYPFAETNEAIARVESGRAKGKVVIKMS